MRWILLLIFTFPALAQADVSPAQWLENCLAQPVPELEKTDAEAFATNTDIQCLSSFPSVCTGFGDFGECMRAGIVFLNTSYDQNVANFPDFSDIGNAFSQRRYQRLSTSSASDSVDAFPNCDFSPDICDFFARTTRLMTIREAMRAIAGKTLRASGENQ